MDRKVRLEFLVRKNEGKRYKDVYLREMNSLLDIKIDEGSLISLEETDHIRKIVKNRNEEVLIHEVIDFNNKKELHIIINKYSDLFEDGIYVLSGYSEFCGAVFVKRFEDLNLYFSFKAEHSGIIFIVSSDLKSIISLDFYEEDEKEYLEIEVITEI